MVLVNDWYPTRTTLGSANDILSTLASNANLAMVARRIDVEKYMTLPASSTSPITSEHGLATIIEAIIGAAYLDSDISLNAARRVMAGFGLQPATEDGTVSQSGVLSNDVSKADDDFAHTSKTASSANPPSAQPININISIPPSKLEEPLNINVSVQIH